jgi:ABC-type transport system substrate-binding protein
VYTSPSGGRLRSEVKTNSASDNEAEASILADGWRRAGFDVREAVLPAAQAQDNEVRSTFPGMYSNNTTQGESALLNQVSGRIPGPNNRWSGSNRGGWSNDEYDRLGEVFSTTLDRSEREQMVGQMVRLHTTDVGTISLLFRVQPWVAVSALKGMDKVVAPEAYMSWDIHNWELN